MIESPKTLIQAFVITSSQGDVKLEPRDVFFAAETGWLVGGTGLELAGGVATGLATILFVWDENGAREDDMMMPLKFNSKPGMKCMDSKHGGTPDSNFNGSLTFSVLIKFLSPNHIRRHGLIRCVFAVSALPISRIFASRFLPGLKRMGQNQASEDISGNLYTINKNLVQFLPPVGCSYIDLSLN